MECAGTYKITRAGQVTIPVEIRQEMGLKEGTPLDFYYDGNIVLIRKKRTPVEVFDELAKATQKRFKERGIKRKDVFDAIKAARNEMRDS